MKNIVFVTKLHTDSQLIKNYQTIAKSSPTPKAVSKINSRSKEREMDACRKIAEKNIRHLVL
jgi:hypothetical protein